jgi:predicted enzyme related to lactoylglutathione lyase
MVAWQPFCPEGALITGGRMLKSMTLTLALTTLTCGAVAGQENGPHYRPSVVLQLGVSNLDNAIEFYEKKLGFKTVERRDDLQFAHVETNVPGLQIGLSVGSKQSGTGAAIVNLSVADVATARTLLESRGVVFTGPTQVIPGKVTLAGFRDPDGNQLRLAGPPRP